MNVIEFMTEAEVLLSESSPATFIHRRRKTFLEFLRIESQNGGVIHPPHLRIIMTRQGQETVRVLLSRVLEEYIEALEAADPLHLKEEVIDSYNYLLSVMFYTTEDADQMFSQLYKFPELADQKNGGRYLLEKLPELMVALGDFLKLLRLRPWQLTVQEEAGKRVEEGFIHFFLKAQEILLAVFESQREFEKLFLAKDLVLQFRIESHY